MPHANGAIANGTRVIALVGPAGAGKTSLAEAMLFAAGATDRLGSTANGSSIGDSSPEARQRGGSTELNLYNFKYLDDEFALIDTPGSIGFAADGVRGIAAADMAIVVVDPDPARAPLAAPALRTLDELGIPHLIFVNRIDQAHGRIRDLLSALQPVSVSPLIARQIPIREGEKVTGFIDLALERAYHYVPGKESERIEIPEDLQQREAEARTQCWSISPIMTTSFSNSCSWTRRRRRIRSSPTSLARPATASPCLSSSARRAAPGESAACSRRCGTKLRARRPLPTAWACRTRPFTSSRSVTVDRSVGLRLRARSAERSRRAPTSRPAAARPHA